MCPYIELAGLGVYVSSVVGVLCAFWLKYLDPKRLIDFCSLPSLPCLGPRVPVVFPCSYFFLLGVAWWHRYRWWGGKPAELGLSTHLLPGVEQAHTDDGTSSSELSKALPCKWYRSHSNMVKRRRRKSGVKERGSMLTHKFLGGPLLADVIY